MARSTWPRGPAAVAFALLGVLAILAAPLAPVAAAQSQPIPQKLDALHVSPEPSVELTGKIVVAEHSFMPLRR
jgi:hypothetical protein